MIQKQITTESVRSALPLGSSKNDEQLKQLYETAFPKEEQIPWDELVRLIGEMHLDFTAYYEGESFIGFTIVFPYEPFNWYWYFAVRPELRGQGKGQQILTDLLEKYKGQSCILDMESPRQECNNKEQRQRRHAFYLRNGFRDTNLYRCWDDLEMTIMMTGPGTVTCDVIIMPIYQVLSVLHEIRKYRVCLVGIFLYIATVHLLGIRDNIG